MPRERLPGGESLCFFGSRRAVVTARRTHLMVNLYDADTRRNEPATASDLLNMGGAEPVPASEVGCS